MRTQHWREESNLGFVLDVLYFWNYRTLEQQAFVLGITGCHTNRLSVQGDTFFELLGTQNNGLSEQWAVLMITCSILDILALGCFQSQCSQEDNSRGLWTKVGPKCELNLFSLEILSNLFIHCFGNKSYHVKFFMKAIVKAQYSNL